MQNSGWNHPLKKDESAEQRKPNRSKGWLACIVITIVASVAAWFFIGSGEDVHNSQDKRTTKPPAVVTNLVRKVQPPVSQPAQTNTVATKDGAANEQKLPKPATTNVASFRLRKEMVNGEWRIRESKAVFKHPIERALYALTIPNGMAIPPKSIFRRYTKEQILEMLKKPVEISPDDSEHVAERKKKTQAMKDGILDLYNRGHSLDDIIADLDKTSRSENFEMADARLGLNEAMHTGDAGKVREYVAKKNAELAAKGLEELKVPSKFLEQPDEPTSVESASANQTENTSEVQNKEEN